MPDQLKLPAVLQMVCWICLHAQSGAGRKSASITTNMTVVLYGIPHLHKQVC